MYRSARRHIDMCNTGQGETALPRTLLHELAMPGASSTSTSRLASDSAPTED